MQSGLQDITYLKLQISTSTSVSIPNGLLASLLASSWYICTILIHLMIPDVHLQRSLHLIKSGPGLRTCKAWGPLVYYQGLRHSRRSDFPEDKADVRTREKSLATSSRAFIHIATKECSRVIRFTPWWVGDLQKDQLLESYIPQWVGVLSYVRTFKGNDVPQA